MRVGLCDPLAEGAGEVGQDTRKAIEDIKMVEKRNLEGKIN